MAEGYLETKTSPGYGSRLGTPGVKKGQTTLTVHSALSAWLATHSNMKMDKLTAAAEQRKNNKPLMEKKRRARINACLSQLKHLVLQAIRKEGCSYTKLEKADILEMTVQYLRGLHRQHFMNSAAYDPTVMNKYLSGYHECSNEVIRYVSTLEGVDSALKMRLLQHLASGVQGLAAMQVMAYFPSNQQALPSHVTGRYVQDNLAQVRRTSAQMMAAGREELREPCTTTFQNMRFPSESDPKVVGQVPKYEIRPQLVPGQEGTFTLVPKVLPSGQVTTVLLQPEPESKLDPTQIKGDLQPNSLITTPALPCSERKNHDRHDMSVINQSEGALNLSKNESTDHHSVVRSVHENEYENLDIQNHGTEFDTPQHEEEAAELKNDRCVAADDALLNIVPVQREMEALGPVWRPW